MARKRSEAFKKKMAKLKAAIKKRKELKIKKKKWGDSDSPNYFKNLKNRVNIT